MQRGLAGTAQGPSSRILRPGLATNTQGPGNRTNGTRRVLSCVPAHPRDIFVNLDKTVTPRAEDDSPDRARKPGQRASADAATVLAEDEKEETLRCRLERWGWLLCAIFTGNVVYTAYHHDIVLAFVGGILWPVAWAWMLITHGVNVTLLHESVAWFFR